MLNFLIMAYGMLVGFVLLSAERNRREMRPHGTMILRAGETAMSASATLALLLLGWVVLHAMGLGPEPRLP